MRKILSKAGDFKVESYSLSERKLILCSESSKKSKVYFLGVNALCIQTDMVNLSLVVENIAMSVFLPQNPKVEYDKNMMIYHISTDNWEGYVIAAKCCIAES